MLVDNTALQGLPAEYAKENNPRGIAFAGRCCVEEGFLFIVLEDCGTRMITLSCCDHFDLWNRISCTKAGGILCANTKGPIIIYYWLVRSAYIVMRDGMIWDSSLHEILAATTIASVGKSVVRC